MPLVGLPRQALRKGIQAQSSQWDVLQSDENELYLHTLKPIRDMYKVYSTTEFLRRLPILSKRLARTGEVEAEFHVFDEIGGRSQGNGPKKLATWIKRSYKAFSTSIEVEKSANSRREYLNVWSARLVQDVIDVCSVYPELVEAFQVLVLVSRCPSILFC